jgi:hypothetical protein
MHGQQHFLKLLCVHMYQQPLVIQATSMYNSRQSMDVSSLTLLLGGCWGLHECVKPTGIGACVVGRPVLQLWRTRQMIAEQSACCHEDWC